MSVRQTGSVSSYTVYVNIWFQLYETHNLQFDGLAVQLNGTNLKVHSNGADVALSVGVILQTINKTQTQPFNRKRDIYTFKIVKP